MSLATVAWTLVHFVWQGALVAALTAWALRAVAPSRSEHRYAVACAGFGVLALAPIATALTLPHASPGAALSWEVSLSPMWPRAVVAAWGLGVALLTVRFGLELAGISRLRARSVDAPPWMQQVFQRLQRQIGAPAATLRLIPGALSPMAVGVFRPAVLFPASLLTQLPAAQLEALLAHELAHLRRWDYAVNLLQSAVETLLFYHPAVWWLSRRVREERECCCDALAAEVCGDRRAYAHALADLAALRLGAFQAAPAAQAGSLLDRVRRVVGLPGTQERAPWALPSLVLGVVLGAISTVAVSASAASPGEIQELAIHLERRAVALRVDANWIEASGAASATFTQSDRTQDVEINVFLATDDIASLQSPDALRTAADAELVEALRTATDAGLVEVESEVRVVVVASEAAR